MLFRPWNMFCNFTSALPQYVCSASMAVVCSSLISCFPGMLLRYCLSDFEMVPVAPIITGIAFVVTFHMCWIHFTRSLYFKIFSASSLHHISVSRICNICYHARSSFNITDYDVRLMVRNSSVCSHLLVTLPSWLVSTDFGTWSYEFLLSNFTPISVHMLKCSSTHTCHISVCISTFCRPCISV